MPTWDPNDHDYPGTVWSDQGKTGPVSGRVTASVNGSVGLGYAYVAVVNASNVSQEYYNTTADAYGNYLIDGLNATYSSVLYAGPDGTASTYRKGTGMYRVYAHKASYGEGYTVRFGIDANESMPTTTSILILQPDQFPPGAFGTNYGPETVWSKNGMSGNATGRVTTSVNGTIGVPGAYIALVNASNVSEEYYNTTSDENGYYVITGINASYSSVIYAGPDGSGASYLIGTNTYKVYAYKAPYGKGYSAAFGIDANESAAVPTSIVIFPEPASIMLNARRLYVISDGSDNIRITATMYDALGNTVADGYNINFTVGNATNNSFLWLADGPHTGATGSSPYVPHANGSLSLADNTANFYQGHTRDNIGAASVQFGWVDEPYSGNSSTIWAYWDNGKGQTLINASIKVDFIDKKPPGISDVLVNRTSIGFSDSIKLSYTLNDADATGNDVYLLVTDQNGIPVKSIDTGTQCDGRHDIIWDGLCDNGTHVPDGNYSLEVIVNSPISIPGQLKLIKQHEYLHSPYGIALDSDGNVIVADFLNNAVKRIYPNGTTRSIGNGFIKPYSVAVGQNDIIYVSDMGNNAIKCIYPNGTIDTIGSGFNMPGGIAVDHNGNVYVADSANNATKMIYPNGTIVTLYDNTGSPEMVAVDEQGNVYVTQMNGNVIKEIYTNKTVRTLPHMVNVPMGVAVDSNGNVYVTDILGSTITVLYTNGTSEALCYRLQLPWGLAIDSEDNLYLAEAGLDRVLEFYRNGSTRTFISDVYEPHAAVHTANGDIYVACDNFVKVVHSDNTVENVGSGFNDPSGLDIDASGNVYVADSGNDAIKVIRPDLTIVTIGSGFKSPKGVAVDDDGNVYVADTGNKAIKRIYPNNTTITIKSLYTAPLAIDVDRYGNIYIGNYDNGVFEILYPNGSDKLLGNGFHLGNWSVNYGWAIMPNGIAVDESGDVFVPDYDNSTIDVIRPDGSVVRMVSEALHSPISLSIDALGNLCIADTNAVSVFTSPYNITSDPIAVTVTGIPITFKFDLDEGWNLISFPALPEDTNITRLLPEDVRSHIFVIWSYWGGGSWKYWTELPGYTSTMNTVDTFHGYLVWCDAPVSFNITGRPPANGEIPLTSGDYNIVGYPRLYSTDPAAVYNDTLVVWGYKNGNWSYYTTLPGYVNTLDSLDPGYGYEVYK